MGSEAHWCHILWQRHGLRIEEFLAMPRRQRVVYIASELYEGERPCRRDSVYARP